LIVHQDIHDELVAKVVEKTKQIKVGPTDDQSNFMGPVINATAHESILNYIKVGAEEGKLLTGGKGIGNGGYFIEPTVIDGIKPDDRLAQEEIFGPVLAVITARDFDHALEVANNTMYGLTGAVYSNSEAHLAKARATFHVGNLYLNRKCTGALVGVHPFGGFNMSGTDSKAGGRDYLGLFQQGKSVSRRVD